MGVIKVTVIVLVEGKGFGFEAYREVQFPIPPFVGMRISHHRNPPHSDDYDSIRDVFLNLVSGQFECYLGDEIYTEDEAEEWTEQRVKELYRDWRIVDIEY